MTAHTESRSVLGPTESESVIVVAGEALVDLIISADGQIAAKPGGGPATQAGRSGALGLPARCCLAAFRAS
jgi:hypothetical protein